MRRILGLLIAAGAVAASWAPGGRAAPTTAAPRFAIEPGHERLFQAVLPAREGELEAGWGLRGMAVPQDHVEALYGPIAEPRPTSCQAAPLCVRLVHPSLAREEGRVAGPYGITTTAPERSSRLIEGIAARLEAAKPADPFKRIKIKLQTPEPLPDAQRVPDAPGAELEARFAALVDAEPDLEDRLLRVELEPTRARLVFRGDAPGPDGAPPESVVELKDRTPRQSDPDEVTRSFFVQGRGVTSPPDLAARVHAAILAADDGSLRLQAEDVMATGERPWLHTLLIALSALFLLGLLAVLVPLLGTSAGILGRADHRAITWVLLGAGVVLRLVLDYRMVEMGIGYQLARLADELILPRYGAGTTTLHHALFQVFGADHVTMVSAHKVIDSLTLPLAAAAGVRLAGARGPALAPFWAGALALTPILLKSDLTESNLVPVLWGLWTALLAWEARTGWVRVVGTAAGLGFAALCRPEMAAIAPALWVVPCAPWRRPKPALLVGVILLAAIPFQLAFVQHVVDWEMGEGSLHLSKGLSAERLWRVLGNNALLDWRLVPIVAPLLGLGALAVRGTRGRVLLWLIGGLLWLYVYAVDLSEASQPRLHIVGVLPWSLAAALTASVLWRWRRAAGIVALVLWAGSAAATVPTLWAPTNEDTQDALFDRLEESLPEGPFVLSVLMRTDAPDPPGHFTHRHIPSYRLIRGEMIPLGGVAARLLRQEEGDPPLLYFQGVSCYARLLRSASGERGLLPACEAMHARFELEPAWSEIVPSHGNPVHQELGYYGLDSQFEVGLFRVRGLRGRVAP